MPRSFDVASQVYKKFAVRLHLELLLLIDAGHKIRGVVAGDRGAIVGELRVAQLVNLAVARSAGASVAQK